MKNTLFRRSMAVAVLAVLVVVFTASVGFAVPAAPGVHELKHQDGTTVKARQWGDESLHGWQTEDGYTIVFDAARKSWTYAVAGPDGSLVSSGKVAGRDAAPASLSKKLRPTAKYRAAQPAKRMTREAKPGEAPALNDGKTKSGSLESVLSPDGKTKSTLRQKVVPPAGTANIPVILVNFSDRTTTYLNTDFSTLLFGTGNFSMKDFYQEVSYGTFDISAGTGGIGLWSTATNTHDYYGANVAGDDQFPGTLVREAVAAADSAGFDFASYDQDGDCYVDVVNIVHQGSGEEASGVATDIWSHRWSLNSAFFFGQSDGGAYTTNDICSANTGTTVKVNDYVIQPETYGGGMVTVGVFAHEYGHALGLPDLYDTDYTSEGVGEWSLMAGGSWNFDTTPGDRPAHPDAWSKFFLGWVTPTIVNGTMTNEVISAASVSPDVYQLLDGAPKSGEYFLVENRRKTGFDAGLPGEGLLLWHIDGTYITDHPSYVNASECYPPADCSANHYGVALVQADNAWDMEQGSNRGDTGDPYASPAYRHFTGTTAPNSNLYSGGASFISIANISAPGAAMTATFSTPANVYFVNESFSGGALPSGWTVVNNVGMAGWTFNDPGGRTNLTGGAGGFAIVDSDNAGGVNIDTELISPVLDLTAASTASLQFKTDFYVFSGAEVADVDVSNNNGSTWTNVWRKTGVSYAGPKTETVDITALAAGRTNVKIRFHYYNANWEWWWQVDDVRVLTTLYTNTLVVTKSGSGSGTVASDPVGIGCGGTCAASYSAGASVTLTAYPQAGSSFIGWSGACTGTGTCMVTMDSAKSVIAEFKDLATTLYETFDSGTLPSGWTVVNNIGTAGWTFTDHPITPRGNQTGGTGFFAFADSDGAGSVAMDTELISPTMDLSGVSAVSLEFKTDFNAYSGSEIADVDVSINNGSTWTNVWRKTGGSYTGPQTETVDIASIAAGQANVKIRFHYYNANFDWWWQVDDVKVTLPFNAGAPHILWRNTLTGENTAWYMDGAIMTGYAFFTAINDQNWKMAGAGDFNGDGKADIYWRNTANGQNSVWYMDGATRTGAAFLTTVSDLNWQMAGVGDLNGDNKPDIIWRNTASGQNSVWYMDGATRTGSAFLTTVTDLNWQMAGAGDFDGDGKSDILWRNTANGQNSVWYMDGAAIKGSAYFAPLADQDWQIMGARDYNKDATTDILWRNASTGATLIWFLNGTTTIGTGSITPAITDLNWKIAGF